MCSCAKQGDGWAEGSGQARCVAIAVEPTCPVAVCCGFLGGVAGVQPGPTPNEVGGIT